MSLKITYNLFEGEPVGNEDCYYHNNERCTFIGKGSYLTPCLPSHHSACLPGIRIQRDNFKKTLEDHDRKLIEFVWLVKECPANSAHLMPLAADALLRQLHTDSVVSEEENNEVKPSTKPF